MANVALTARALPLRGVVRTDQRSAPVGVFLGVAGLVFAALLMGGLNIVAFERMNPMNTTMSDYVFVPGAGWMFPAAMLATCVAGIGVGVGLAARGAIGGVAPKLSLGLAMLGLLLTASFPTDLGESVSLSAQIHRYAAGVVFFCVPITAVLVARGLPGGRSSLYAGASVASALLVLFLTCHLGPMPDALGEMSGLLQRLLFVADLAVLGQLVLVASRPPAAYALAA